MLATSLLAPKTGFSIEKLTWKETLPGESLADEELQAATVSCLNICESRDTSGCQDRRIVNTEVEDRQFLPVSWTESWHVDHCGKLATYKIFYAIFDGSTSYIEVSGGSCGNWVVTRDGKGTLVKFDGGRPRASKLARGVKNLVRNGSFEQGTRTPVSWSRSGTMGLIEEAIDGSKSLHASIQPVDESVTIFETVEARQVITGVKEGDKVLLSSWIKLKDVKQREGDKVKVSFHFRVKEEKEEGKEENVKDEYAEVGGVTGTQDWTFYPKEVSIPDKTIKTTLTAYLGRCTGTVWFDNIVVTETAKSILKLSYSLTGWDANQEWGQTSATPGVRLSLEETGRVMDPTTGTARFTYKLLGKGFPSKKSFTLWGTPFDTDPDQRVPFPIGFMGEFSIDPDSLEALTSNLGGRLDRATFYVKDFLKGQPYELALISEDLAVKAFAKVIPLPLEARGEGQCRLWLELVNLAGLGYDVYGEGFEPFEEIDIGLQAEGAAPSGKTLKASKDGTFTMPLRPGVIGQDGGKAIITARGKFCQLTVRYQWGSLALQHQ